MSLSSAFALNKDIKTPSYTCESPQVCQFSLNHYVGTINNNTPATTAKIKVKLSCPQTEATRATVIVVIDNELIASDVFTIPANKIESSEFSIEVPTEYKGKKYKLGVQ